MPKILIADDNANIQKMVSLAFEGRGIQVVSVGNGEAAVRRIPDLNPDLVLADIFMPLRNGYEVCEFVKKDERFSHVPVILLVGAFDPFDEKEARRVGADGVLKKPFVPPDPLIAMVMATLEKNPRIAAEMAKAKEAKEVLPPKPVAQLEIPARAEPKPLPDFPEPTPEEAALVYGFGTGRRALDEEQTKTANEPKAPRIEAEEAAEDEFDGASTSRDWRRNAMNFEIPAEDANRPAFSADQGLEPAMFPSERDFPPRHIRVPDPVEESDPVAQDSAPAVVLDSGPVVAQPELPAQAFLDAPSVPAEDIPEIVWESAPAAEPEPAPEPVQQAGPVHWMDKVAEGQSDYRQRDWMTALSEQSAEDTSVSSAGERQTDFQLPSAAPIESVETQASLDSHAPQEAPQTLALDANETSESAFFEDEPASSALDELWNTPAVPLEELVQAAAAAPEPIAIADTKPDQKVESEETQPSFALEDPAAVQPPAIRMGPEPLLVDDEAHGPSQYGAHPQELQPLHSFFAPPSGDPVVEEPVAQEVSRHDETPVAPFEAPTPELDERIPTGPPPDREARAEIPFLTPPPDFHAEPHDDAGADSDTIDAVVRKVLEKLEPQLHNILSQGVLKPLVENLLQSELAKKEK